MRIEPDVLNEHWKELRKQHFFKSAISTLFTIAGVSAWLAFLVYVLVSDKFYW